MGQGPDRRFEGRRPPPQRFSRPRPPFGPPMHRQGLPPRAEEGHRGPRPQFDRDHGPSHPPPHGDERGREGPPREREPRGV
jgi:hypothetical protein